MTKYKCHILKHYMLFTLDPSVAKTMQVSHIREAFNYAKKMNRRFCKNPRNRIRYTVEITKVNE